MSTDSSPATDVQPFAMEEAMANLADGVYIPYSQIGDWSMMMYWNSTGYGLVNGTDKAVIYQNGDQCAVAFAGSDDLQDWIDDLAGAFGTKSLEACGLEEIHMGIFEEMQQFVLSPEWSRDFVPFLDANCTGGISVTGHSLGGGLASLLAACSNNVGSSVFVPPYIKWGNQRMEGRQVRMPMQEFSLYSIGAPALSTQDILNGMAPNGIFHGARSYISDRFSQDPVPSVAQMLGLKHPKVASLGLRRHWSGFITLTRDRGHVLSTPSLPLAILANPDFHRTTQYLRRFALLNTPQDEIEEPQGVEAPDEPSESELRESNDDNWDFSDLPGNSLLEEELVRLVSHEQTAQTVQNWNLELTWTKPLANSLGLGNRMWRVALYRNSENDCVVAFPTEGASWGAHPGDATDYFQTRDVVECGLVSVHRGLYDRFRALVASTEWGNEFVPFIQDHCQGSVIAAGHGRGGGVASLLATCANAVDGAVQELAADAGGAVVMPINGFSALYTTGAPGASKVQLVNARSPDGSFAGTRFFLNDALAQDNMPPSGSLMGYLHPKVSAVRLRRSHFRHLFEMATYTREVYDAHSDAAKTYPLPTRQLVSWYHRTWYYARGIRLTPKTVPELSVAQRIARSVCEWRDDIFVRHDSPVDNTTMSCMNAGFRKVCGCRFPGDCYVRSSSRPEPRDLKRCFNPDTQVNESARGWFR